MGNSIRMSSSAAHIDPNDYQIIGKTNIIRWGEVYETQNSSTGQKVYMQERFTNDYETHKKNITECSHRLSLSHNNLVCLLGFSQTDTPDSSNNTYKINLYFEYVATTLSDLIDMRVSNSVSANNKASGKKVSMQYFDESELVRYLNQLIDVFSFLQMNEICLGDITPDVCFLSEHGNIKILDRKLLFRNTSVYDLIKQGSTDVFPTPGELKALENGYSRSPDNRYKADIFRLGITMVECATLKKGADIYDWRTQSINIEALSSRLIDIKDRYSISFYNTVRELLRFDEGKRPDFLMLNQKIQEEAAVNLDSTLSKTEEAQLKSPQMNNNMNKLKVTSPLASKRGEHLEEKSINVKSPFQNEKQASNQKVSNQEYSERGRTNRGEESARKNETLEDDTQEFENNMKINNIRYNESLNIIDNAFTRHQNLVDQKRSNNFNIERVQNPGSAKKATPVKTSANETTPSKSIRIFGPIKSPEPLQNQQIFSPSRGTEKNGRAFAFQSPEDKTDNMDRAEKMYSPFDHRPSHSDITSPPISAQHFNFENLKNFPQLGKYTRLTATEKNPLSQSSSLENTLPSRISPSKNMSQSYFSPNKPQTSSPSLHFNEPQAPGFSMSSYFSPKTKPDIFNPLDDRRSSGPNYQNQSQQAERLSKSTSPIQEVNVNMMGKLSNKETGPEKYFDAYGGNFAGAENQHEQDSQDLMDAYKMSFSNKAFGNALPTEGREAKKLPLRGQVAILTESSPKSPSFDTRNSLPMFGGQSLREEPRSFGLSSGVPTMKQTHSSPAKTPILGGENIDERSMKIDDRFERAMQRSKRSEGFMKEISRSASKSPLRKTNE